MVKVLYPGSFDPVHNGHMEICAASSRMFDHVVVAVMRNPQSLRLYLMTKSESQCLQKHARI